MQYGTGPTTVQADYILRVGYSFTHNVWVLSILAQNARLIRCALSERAIIPLPRRNTPPQQYRGKGIP